MNIWEMVVLIVAIGAIASVLRARYGTGMDAAAADHRAARDAEQDSVRAQEEIHNLKERIAVLERIATDNNRGLELDREIERLRDRG